MHVLYVDRASYHGLIRRLLQAKFQNCPSSLAVAAVHRMVCRLCIICSHPKSLGNKKAQPAIFQAGHLYVHPVYMRNNIFISLYIRAWNGLLHVFTMLYCHGSGWIGAKAAEMEIEGFLGSKPLDPAWSKSVQAQRPNTQAPSTQDVPRMIYTIYNLHWSQMWWTRLDMCWKSVEYVSKYSEYNHVLFHVVPPCSPWILNDPHAPTEKCALRGRPPSVR